jgi:hypothetical protein
MLDENKILRFKKLKHNSEEDQDTSTDSTDNSTSSRASSPSLIHDADNDIDVETFSNHDENSSYEDNDDDVNSPSSTKENNSTTWSFHLSPSQSSNSTSAQLSKNNDETLKNKQNQLNNQESGELNKKSLYTNGKLSQQRSAPILVNGKKYYRKKIFIYFILNFYNFKIFNSNFQHYYSIVQTVVFGIVIKELL